MTESGNPRNSPERNRGSFGARFGELVRTKRGEEGLTQMALAGVAFGEEDREKRISELETGRIAKPQQKTVDALVVALAITEDELRFCHAPQIPDLPPGYVPELGLTEGLVGRLAWDFGHDNPRASLGEYQQFLRDKAKEYKALRAEMDVLKASDARLANQIAAAEGALERGDTEEAEAILEDARALSKERSLEAVKQTAQIIALQARAALLRNDAGSAYEHFRTAASFVAALDSIEAVAVRNVYGDTLREHAERFGGVALNHAIDLANQNLRACSQTEDPRAWAMTQNNLANALRVMGERAGGEEGLKALTRAVEAYEAALEVHTRAEMRAAWAHSATGCGSARIGLGIATVDGALIENGIAMMDEALPMFRSVASETAVSQVLEARARGVDYLIR